MRLRSVELELPRRDAAVEFLRDTWGLLDAGRRGRTEFLRGAGDHPYLVSLTEAGPHFVDLDDSRMGPAMQDLWMLLSGDRAAMSLQLRAVLDGDP